MVISWHAQWVIVLQWAPHFSSLKYNTALCFIACGIALLSLINGHPKKTRWLGGGVILLALLTMSEYLFSCNLGIDQLFFRAYSDSEAQFPGRMSPLSAGCLLMGGSLTLMAFASPARKALAIAGMSACVVSVIAIVNIVSYAMALDSAYDSGSYTRMALPTAIAFFFLSMGLLPWIWQVALAVQFNFVRWLPVTGAVTLIVMLAFISLYGFRQQKKLRHLEQALL